MLRKEFSKKQNKNKRMKFNNKKILFVHLFFEKKSIFEIFIHLQKKKDLI